MHDSGVRGGNLGRIGPLPRKELYVEDSGMLRECSVSLEMIHTSEMTLYASPQTATHVEWENSRWPESEFGDFVERLTGGLGPQVVAGWDLH